MATEPDNSANHETTTDSSPEQLVCTRTSLTPSPVSVAAQDCCVGQLVTLSPNSSLRWVGSSAAVLPFHLLETGCCLGFPVYNLVILLAGFGLSIWGFEAYAASRHLSEASSECIHTYLYISIT